MKGGKRSGWLVWFLLSAFFVPNVYAVTDYFKADNDVVMAQPPSWVGGVVPPAVYPPVSRAWLSGNTQPWRFATGVYNFNFVGIVVTNSDYDWTIGPFGQPIRNGAEGITIAAGNQGNFTIEQVIRLTSDQPFHVADADRTLTILGEIVDFKDNTAGGATGITKTGDGTLLLSAANTFSGGLIVNGGTVQAGADNVLGTGTMTLNTSSRFYGGGHTQSNPISIQGSTRIDGDAVLSGTLSGPGSIALGDGDPNYVVRLQGNNSGFSGTITNSAVLVTNNRNGFGTGTLVLKQGSILAADTAFDLTGAEAIGNAIQLHGVVRFGATVATGDLDLAGPISGAGGLLLEQGGVTLRLSGANSYSGNTVVGAGTLVIDGDNSASTGVLTVRNGATLGGNGTIGGDLLSEAGSGFDVDPARTLNVVAGKKVHFEDFGVENMTGVAAIEPGTYTWIDGDIDVASTIRNIGADNAFVFPGGKNAYFEPGTLRLVVLDPKVRLIILSSRRECTTHDRS